jgi:hypothetical protein
VPGLSSIDGRTLHLKLDLVATPRDPRIEAGSTDAAMEVGKRLAQELGLLAQRLVGEGYAVTVDREMVVY